MGAFQNASDSTYLTDRQISDLWTQVEDHKDKSLTQRRPKESVWRMARRYFEGDQWYRVNRENYALEPVPLPPKRPKITVNRLQPGVLTRLAHVLKNKPTGVVVPASNDEEDRNAARVGTSVVEYDLRRERLDEKLATQIGPEMFLTNNSFAKVYYDMTKGPLVQPQTPKLDPFGQPLVVNGEPVMTPSGDPHPQGEPVVEVVAPEEFLPEPGARRLEECQAVIHRTLKPLDYVKRLFGAAADGLKPVDTNSETGSAIVAGARHYGYDEHDVRDRVEVLEVWARPDLEKWPQGLHAVFANERCMLAEPTPRGHDAIPFVHFQEIPSPWEFWGTSSAMQALDPQRALNMVVSRDEYRRTVQRPKMLTPNQAGLDDEDVDNDDRTTVSYEYPFKPEWSGPDPYVADERARQFYIDAMDDIFGNVAILSGEADGEVRSGRQAYIQGEYAGTVLSGPARSIERGVCRVGSLILKLRKEWTDQEQTIQIVGRDRNIEVLNFKGADLDGGTDFWVQPGSALPSSRAEKKQLILDLWDRQILTPDMKDRVLKMIDMPSDLDAFIQEDQVDRDRAEEENAIFLSLTQEHVAAAKENHLIKQAAVAPVPQPSLPPMPGALPSPGLPPGLPSAPPMVPPGMEPRGPAVQAQPGELALGMLKALRIEPRDFENHAVHIERHNRFRKSRRYRELPEPVQALVDEHVDRHLLYIAPPPAMPPMLGGKGGEGEGNSPSVTPSALVPGGAPVGAAGAGAGGEPAADMAAGMPPMPPTPSPMNPTVMF